MILIFHYDTNMFSSTFPLTFKVLQYDNGSRSFSPNSMLTYAPFLPGSLSLSLIILNSLVNYWPETGLGLAWDWPGTGLKLAWDWPRTDLGMA